MRRVFPDLTLLGSITIMDLLDQSWHNNSRLSRSGAFIYSPYRLRQRNVDDSSASECSRVVEWRRDRCLASASCLKEGKNKIQHILPSTNATF